jgi:hypothetical protein
MHHYVRVIDHDPVAHRVPVHGGRRHVVIRFQPVLDLTGNRLEMRLRGSAANHKKIRECRNAPQIQGNEIFRLFIGRQRSAALGQFCARQDEMTSR